MSTITALAIAGDALLGVALAMVGTKLRRVARAAWSARRGVPARPVPIEEADICLRIDDGQVVVRIGQFRHSAQLAGATTDQLHADAMIAATAAAVFAQMRTAIISEIALRPSSTLGAKPEGAQS